MSVWTYAIGAINVDCVGRNDLEKEYYLKTVLSHMPLVTGSEGDMLWGIMSGGVAGGSYSDEFGYRGTSQIESHRKHTGHYSMQDHNHIITLSGSFRDRKFEQTLKEMVKFLFRLSKHVCVLDISVTISCQDKSYSFTDNNLFDYIYSDIKSYSSILWECRKDELRQEYKGRPEHWFDKYGNTQLEF